MSLAKVTFIKSVKVRRYGPCGGVAAFYIKSMVMCQHTHVIQTPGNHPKERIQHSEYGESLKSRKIYTVPNFAYKTSSSKTKEETSLTYKY
jgi:hypothetical protein